MAVQLPVHISLDLWVCAFLAVAGGAGSMELTIIGELK
jgi:hypothetical protein